MPPIPAELGVNRTKPRQRSAQRNQTDKGDVPPGRRKSTVKPKNHGAHNQPRDTLDGSDVPSHFPLLQAHDDALLTAPGAAWPCCRAMLSASPCWTADRTTSTGTAAARTNLSATLPSARRPMPSRP